MTKNSNIAHELAKKQKEISVAEFFERNKHILGFDTVTKSMITAVKEGVDNALDACEEAGILPEILVDIKKTGNNECRLIIEDNGPGIVRKQVPKIFGQLLYGSRFHAIRQSRGQQGIGISAVVMYGQFTTGKHAIVRSKIGKEDVAHEFDLVLDTKKNRPHVLREEPKIWEGKEHGTRLEVTLNGKVIRGKQSVYEYLRGTAIVNPHAQITYRDPDRKKYTFERVVSDLPPHVNEIRPHPEGIELGTFLNMLKAAKHNTLKSFLAKEFSSVSYSKAKEICEAAKLDEKRRPKRLDRDQAKALVEAFEKVKFRAPDTSCLSPIGPQLIKKGLKNVLGDMKPSFYSPPVTRPAKVHRGHPFQVEVGIVYGGDLPREGQVEILRFANRVPLLYQQGACACTRAIESIDWRRYGLDQRGGRGIPSGPAVFLIHVASTKVPFTSESKEAIANIPQITEEIQRGLRDCARKLHGHLSKHKRRGKVAEKFDIVQTLIPKIAEKASEIVGKPMPDLAPVITKVMDIVQIQNEIKFSKGTHTATVTLNNYTEKAKKLKLYMVVPDKAASLLVADPKPSSIDGGRLMWEFKRLLSGDKATITLQLHGLDKKEYDENEIYIDGIDATRLMGAEPLPGDWGVKRQRIIEEQEEEEPADEELEDDEPEAGKGAAEVEE